MSPKQEFMIYTIEVPPVRGCLFWQVPSAPSIIDFNDEKPASNTGFVR
jgi:hypothetical protein